jgi:DNA-binding transcriptional regulator YiaG
VTVHDEAHIWDPDSEASSGRLLAALEEALMGPRKLTPEQIRDAQTKRIGRTIRSLRGPMTQHSLGKAIGVNHSKISDWERGAQRPSEVHQHLLAAFFGVTVGYLHDEHP